MKKFLPVFEVALISVLTLMTSASVSSIAILRTRSGC